MKIYSPERIVRSRLQINYPGTGNNSQLTYDGLNGCVKIVETTGGSITSTKQFVRSQNVMREARDVSGSLTAQYFSLGQTGGGSNYFYHLTQRGDVVGVTDSTGNQLASIAYDAYGRPSVFSDSYLPDFGFTGLYLHQRSGLSLATYRAYNSALGRWFSRDPIFDIAQQRKAISAGMEESWPTSPNVATDLKLFQPVPVPAPSRRSVVGLGTEMLYRYAKNDPIDNTDLSGLYTTNDCLQFYIVCLSFCTCFPEDLAKGICVANCTAAYLYCLRGADPGPPLPGHQPTGGNNCPQCHR